MNRPARPRTPAPGARRIESAARRLFASRGYAGTSMAEIAAAAGVSKATVFHHYRSKRALYEALLGDAFAGFREQLIPLLDTERNLLLIKGAGPGPNGGLLIVRNTVKGA